MTLRDAYEVLDLGSDADSQTIEAMYWRRAHALAKQRAADPDAADELERLSNAYHAVMHHRLHGPPVPRVALRPSPRRRFAFAGVALALAAGSLLVGLGFRDQIQNGAERSIHKTQQGLDTTVTWLQSIDGEPTPTSPPAEEVSGTE